MLSIVQEEGAAVGRVLVKVLVRNQKGKAVLDFKGIPVEQVSQLVAALTEELPRCGGKADGTLNAVSTTTEWNSTDVKKSRRRRREKEQRGLSSRTTNLELRK